MANQFIKDTGAEVIKFDTPSFVNSGASTSDIVRGAVASTSGNNFLDIAINKAINYSQKLDVMKANNEKAKHSIELQKSLQDYENMWQKTGLNKYEDDNYDKYVSGLNEIYDTAKMNFATTKYTRESDVLNWENSLDEERNRNLFMQRGEKAKFDIQSVTDETLMNVSAMANNYIMNGNYEDLKEAVKLIDGLSYFIPKHKLDEMKRTQVMNAEQNKMKNDIERIVNSPSMSIEEKRNSLAKIQQGIANNKQSYEYMAKQAIEMGFYEDTKDGLTLAKSDYQAMYQEALNKNGGILSVLESKIRDEKYNHQVMIENFEIQRREAREREIQSIQKSFDSKDPYQAISLLEGRYVEPQDLIMDIGGIGTKYYGKNPHEILYTKDENGKRVNTDRYIPTTSRGTINRIKEKINIDEANNVDRNSQIKYMVDGIKSEQNLDIKENTKRELVATGVLSKLEAHLLIDGATTVGTTTQEYVEYAHLGRKNVTKNEMRGFVGVSDKIGKAIAPIANNSHKVEELTQIIHGAIVSGRFGHLFGGKNITATSVNVQMSNKEFADFVKETVSMLKDAPTSSYYQANVVTDDNYIYNTVDNRNRNNLNIRYKTKEKGVDFSRAKI